MWDEENSIRCITSVTNTIDNYIFSRKEMEYSKEKFIDLCVGICYVFNIWTGQTWVGDRKEKDISDAFQNFFVFLYKLVCSINDNKNYSAYDERFFAKFISYTGKVYRYLGKNNSQEQEVVVPVYNDIYVSWSKLPHSSYIESKLYGTMTWMAANIQSPYFGIDLEGFEKILIRLTNEKCKVTRGNEREVVFPTFKECIMEVRYIEEDEDDDKI
ncbi:MAG: hypothetical protein HDR01_13800 [Lachnospiraceae bacterium]|nr:hypothetical protein [Lachnospiraceae bacterium]